MRQLDEIGSKSLPLVGLAGSAIGVVLAMQARQSLTQFGAKSLFPSAIVYSVVQEMGPLSPGSSSAAGWEPVSARNWRR